MTSLARHMIQHVVKYCTSAGSTLSDVTDLIELECNSQTLAAGSIGHLLAVQVAFLVPIKLQGHLTFRQQYQLIREPD